MISYALSTGYTIPDLLADINNVCYVEGPFRHGVEFQMERFAHPETRAKANFKLNQMAFHYVNALMQRYPELDTKISHATLAMQIVETLFKNKS